MRTPLGAIHNLVDRWHNSARHDVLGKHSLPTNTNSNNKIISRSASTCTANNSATDAVVEPHHFILMQNGVMGMTTDFDSLIQLLLRDHHSALQAAKETAAARRQKHRQEKHRCPSAEPRCRDEATPPVTLPSSSSASASATTLTRAANAMRWVAGSRGQYVVNLVDRLTRRNNGQNNKSSSRSGSSSGNNSRRSFAPFHVTPSGGRVYRGGHLVCFTPGCNVHLSSLAGTRCCARRLLEEFLPVFESWLSEIEKSSQFDDDDDDEEEDVWMSEIGKDAKEALNAARSDSARQATTHSRKQAYSTWCGCVRADDAAVTDANVASHTTPSPGLPNTITDRYDNANSFVMGDDIGSNVQDVDARHMRRRRPIPVCFSCVGHSFGGVILREFLHALCIEETTTPKATGTANHNEKSNSNANVGKDGNNSGGSSSSKASCHGSGAFSQSLMDALERTRARMRRMNVTLENYVTVATPHCGTTECLWPVMYRAAWLLSQLGLTPTIRELIHTDTDRIFLTRLIDPAHLAALALFRHRTLFANTYRDLLVGFGTSSLLFEPLTSDTVRVMGVSPEEVPCAVAFKDAMSEVSEAIYLPPRCTKQRGKEEASFMTATAAHNGDTDPDSNCNNSNKNMAASNGSARPTRQVLWTSHQLDGVADSDRYCLSADAEDTRGLRENEKQCGKVCGEGNFTLRAVPQCLRAMQRELPSSSSVVPRHTAPRTRAENEEETVETYQQTTSCSSSHVASLAHEQPREVSRPDNGAAGDEEERRNHRNTTQRQLSTCKRKGCCYTEDMESVIFTSDNNKDDSNYRNSQSSSVTECRVAGSDNRWNRICNPCHDDSLGQTHSCCDAATPKCALANESDVNCRHHRNSTSRGRSQSHAHMIMGESNHDAENEDANCPGGSMCDNAVNHAVVTRRARLNEYNAEAKTESMDVRSTPAYSVSPETVSSMTSEWVIVVSSPAQRASREFPMHSLAPPGSQQHAMNLSMFSCPNAVPHFHPARSDNSGNNTTAATTTTTALTKTERACDRGYLGAAMLTAQWVQRCLRRCVYMCAPFGTTGATRHRSFAHASQPLRLTDAQPVQDLDDAGNGKNTIATIATGSCSTMATAADVHDRNTSSCYDDADCYGRGLGQDEQPKRGTESKGECGAEAATTNLPGEDGWLAARKQQPSLPDIQAAPRWIAHTLRHHLGWRLRAIRTATAIPIAHVSCLGYLEWCGASPVIAMAVAEEVSYVLR